MPKYREIVVLSKTTVNGKEYFKNDYVRDVEITEREAEFNNKHPNLTGCKYIISPKDEIYINHRDEPNDPKKELRAKLFKEAEELGIKVPKNISTDKLQQKIDDELQKPNE